MSDRAPFDQHVESDPAWDLAVQLWCQYHVEAEEYDRIVCSGFSEKTKEAMPVGTLEHELVNRHAKMLRRSTLDEGQRRGVPLATMREASIVVGHWPLALQQAIYEMMRNRRSS
jgi:hypothetical protein